MLTKLGFPRITANVKWIIPFVFELLFTVTSNTRLADVTTLLSVIPLICYRMKKNLPT